MGLTSVSNHPTPTNIPRVDGLSTGPPGLGVIGKGFKS